MVTDGMMLGDCRSNQSELDYICHWERPRGACFGGLQVKRKSRIITLRYLQYNCV